LFGTGAAILFKGGGFYETDYRSESYKKAEKAESTTAKPADSTTSTPAAGSTASATGQSSSKPSEPAK
jgi:predicted nucleic acid-binding Zn ribbon protein